MSCGCVADWRVELIDLATGRRRLFLQPLGFTFDTTLNEVGNASVQLPVRALSANDVWPHLRGVVISRIAGPGASTANSVGEYLGMINDYRATSDGSLNLGVTSIESYLDHRIIENDLSYTATDQNVISAALVNGAAVQGVPLTGVAVPGAQLRDRDYLATDDKVRLSAIQDLTKVIDGPDYILTHAYVGGSWSSTITFSDYAGNTSAQPLNARRGLTSYSVTVTSDDHTNWERGRGNGNEYTADTLASSMYPRFDKAQQWSDVDDDDVLAENVLGDLANNPDPTALPEVTISDLELASRFNLGDHVNLTMSHGAIQYQGETRLIRKSWSVGADQPSLCTFGFVPITPPAQSVLAVPFSPTPVCC